MKQVKDFLDGDHIFGQLLVNSVTKGETDKAKTYLTVTLQDRTGSIEAKKWEVSDEDLEIIVMGAVIYIDGVVNKYKDKLQLKLTSVMSVKPEDVDITNFQKPSPVPQEVLEEKLQKYLGSFKDKDIALITNEVIKHFYKEFVIYPGGIRIHHDFKCGVLYHSLSMADLAEEVARLYPQVDRDLLVAGCLLHDIGKTIEYDNPVTPGMSTEGRLVGHISIMYAEFRKIVDALNIQSDVPLLLEHMILSHHGTRDFGCPVLPSTREAVLLSMIDLLDSRMSIMDKALDGVKEGEFSQKVWAMDNVQLYNPKGRK